MGNKKMSGNTGKKRPKSRDQISGDHITVSDIGGDAVVAVGRNASASKTVIQQKYGLEIAEWRSLMEREIDHQPDLSADEKQDLKDTIAKVESEAVKGEMASPSRLEKLIKTLAAMSTDIWEVAITTLANPLSGIGLVIKKIGDRAKIEREAQAS